MATTIVDTAIIGAGAAGLMAGIAAASGGAKVLALERNGAPGRKLLLTGGGRCNVTHVGEPIDLIAGVPGNGRFLYSALNAFSGADLTSLLSQAGVETVAEPDGRVFPRGNKARQVLGALSTLLRESGAELRTGAQVASVEVLAEGRFRLTLADGEELQAAKVIITTGGLSYPATGSTGDGLAWAEALGHRVIPPRPALVGLLTQEEWPRSISGVALEGAAVRLSGVKQPERGSVLFTHFGVSGPPVLNLSRYAVRALAGGAEPPALSISTDPEASLGEWETRLERAAADHPHRTLGGLLSLWWPKALAAVVLGDLDDGQEAAHLPRESRHKAAALLHRLDLTITGSRPLAEALVTQGGVDTSQVNPRTMESKLVPGLFFAGEVLDIDGRSGGYNLQAAFSTGHLAGRASGSPPAEA